MLDFSGENGGQKKNKKADELVAADSKPVVVGLSGCGDEAGGCDEGKVTTGFRVALPALLAGTKTLKHFIWMFISTCASSQQRTRPHQVRFRVG